jgi:recombinational DNA repair ATPase RecF
LVDAEGMHGRESILVRAFAYTQAMRNRCALWKQNGDIMPPVVSNGANGWQKSAQEWILMWKTECNQLGSLVFGGRDDSVRPLNQLHGGLCHGISACVSTHFHMAGERPGSPGTRSLNSHP